MRQAAKIRPVPATITVNPSPSITASANKASYCSGDTIQLSSNPSGGTTPYVSFTWSGPVVFSPNNVQNPDGIKCDDDNDGQLYGNGNG